MTAITEDEAAAREQQLRERIAAEIEKHRVDHDDPWNGALDLAAEIARGGEDQ